MAGTRFGGRRRRTLAAMLPHVLGLPESEHHLIPLAVDRTESFVRSVDPAIADSLRTLFDAINFLSISVYGRLATALDDEQLADYAGRLEDPEDDWPNNALTLLRRVFGNSIPSVLDLSRALKEACSLAWYGLPETHAHTGFVPLWEQPDVLAIDPDSATAAPYTLHDRHFVDAAKIWAARETSDRTDGFFANNGKPKVAIIGAGPAGAICAAELIATCDVAIFEAGPELAPRDFPVDPMASMALVYERSLMYPSRDLDLRVLQARVVGGGSAVNEGVAVRPRASTLDHWARHGAPIDRSLLEIGMGVAERRQRFALYNRELLTSAATRFEAAVPRAGLAVDLLHGDLATNAFQHDGALPDVIGPQCLACGYCNHGCRFGHHLSVDRTFLRDARKAGARLHACSPVSRVAVERGEATGIYLERPGRDHFVPCDHVILAAGAIGSSALMKRSKAHSPALGMLQTAREGNLGEGLGFNYGTPVFATWNDGLARPGYQGLQVGFIASKPGDETYILENGFLPPGVLASVIPGWGREHHRWMGNYGRFGMCVNTIGGHSEGSVSGDGKIAYRIGPSAMGVIHESLAAMVEIYLHAGADEVGISGLLRSTDGIPQAFGQDLRGKSAEIRRRVAHLAPTAEHLSFGSGHPQGGLHLNRDPSKGAVDTDFRIHGVDNLYVADASLFPTTLTVNVLWLVMGLAWTAAQSIKQAVVRPPSR